MAVFTTLTLTNVDYPNNGYQMMVNLDEILFRDLSLIVHGLSELEIDNYVLELGQHGLRAERIYDLSSHYLLRIYITDHVQIKFH